MTLHNIAPVTDTLAPETESSSFDVASIVKGLRAVRDQWRHEHKRLREAGGREFPSREALRDITERLSGALFPMRLGPVDLQQESEDFFVGHTLDIALRTLREQALLELRFAHRRVPTDHTIDGDATLQRQAHVAIQAFAASLPGIRALLDSDVEAAYRGDPAARSVDEVVLCYPGLTAIINHRLAHQLYKLGLPLLARIVAELAHSSTGIDIHPGAQIGHSFFIDHGTGVVIGETAVIGNRVRLYQAVTLGAKRFDLDDNGDLLKGQARHPVVEDDVVIYAGATVLGRITIGAGSCIGGNVWLTRSVPPGSVVTQAHSRHE